VLIEVESLRAAVRSVEDRIVAAVLINVHRVNDTSEFVCLVEFDLDQKLLARDAEVLCSEFLDNLRLARAADASYEGHCRLPGCQSS
jgi:hypothetical protein